MAQKFRLPVAAATSPIHLRAPDNWRGLVLHRAFESFELDTDGEREVFAFEDARSMRWLQSYLVYWDKLISPVSFSSGVDRPPSRSVLEALGVLQKMNAPANLARPPQLIAFDDAELSNPGRWAMTIDHSDRGSLLDNSGRSLVVKLHEVLPVPARPLPFEDLLEFRHRRIDQALALRDRIEALYESILSSPDRPFALNRALEQIGSAVADQCTVMEEAGIRFTFAGLEARIKWEFDAKLSTIAGLATMLVTQSPGAGVAASAMSNLIPKIELSTAAGFAGAARSNRPYGYILHVGHELT